MKNELIISDKEHIDSLQYNSASIILSEELPKFSTDAVLLSAFCNVRKGERVADLGSGTGVISLLINARTEASVIGFEIVPELADMFARSIKLNNRENALTSVCADYCEAYREYNGYFDACVCNPPYFDDKDGAVSDDSMRAVSRTKQAGDLPRITNAANKLLHSGGRLFICYPAVKAVDLICCLRASRLEPKRIRFVRAKAQKAPYLVFIEAKKDGGVSVQLENDLVLLNENGEYSDDACEIYHIDK